MTTSSTRPRSSTTSAAFDAPGGTCQAGANEAPTAADQAVTTDEDTPLDYRWAARPRRRPAHARDHDRTGSRHADRNGRNRTYTPDANYHGDGLVPIRRQRRKGRIGHGNGDDHRRPGQRHAGRRGWLGHRVDVGAATPIPLTASDVDGDTLTYAVVAGPAHGSLSGTGPSRTYIPDPGYEGPDSFTFSADDGMADSNVATISSPSRTSTRRPSRRARLLSRTRTRRRTSRSTQRTPTAIRSPTRS